MDISKQKILITINKKLYAFKSSYCISEYFSNSENIQNIEGLTEEMLNILTKPHLINRVIKAIKGEEQNFILKKSTKDKYCRIPNFTIIRAS